MTTVLPLLTSSLLQGPRTGAFAIDLVVMPGPPLWPRVSAFAAERALVSLWRCFTLAQIPQLPGAPAFFYVLFGYHGSSIWEVGGVAPSISGFPQPLCSLVGPSPPELRPLGAAPLCVGRWAVLGTCLITVMW